MNAEGNAPTTTGQSKAEYMPRSYPGAGRQRHPMAAIPRVRPKRLDDFLDAGRVDGLAL